MHASVAHSVAVNGAFVRPRALFRNWISSDLKSLYQPASDRYHLYISLACPWASRCYAALHMKGLLDCITFSIVHPIFVRTRSYDMHTGWHFQSPGNPPVNNSKGYGNIPCDSELTGRPDPVSGALYIRDLYEEALEKVPKDSEEKLTRFTVPVLWCKKTRTIVSNESEEILRMLNSEFNAFAKNPDLDLFPSALRDKILEVNEWVYHNINNGVYKCGFSQTQESYDEAVDALFVHLDKCEAILTKQRFLAGSQFTEADLRLFVTLVRFDEVYTSYFKTNCRCIREYPALMNYCREIYQIPGVKESVNMNHIKWHYFTSHEWLNYYAIIPKGPNFLKLLNEPHNRALLGD